MQVPQVTIGITIGVRDTCKRLRQERPDDRDEVLVEHMDLLWDLRFSCMASGWQKLLWGRLRAVGALLETLE